MGAIDGLGGGLYTSDSWPDVIAGLSEVKAGRGDILLKIRDGYHGRGPDGAYTNFLEAVLAINCLDEDRIPGPELVEVTEDSYAIAPIFDPGRPIAKSGDPCAGWPIEPTLAIPYATDIGDIPDTLTIASTGDALTPYETAVKLPRALGGSLLTVDGEMHGVILSKNECVANVLAEYLIDLKSPAVGTRCEAGA